MPRRGSASLRARAHVRDVLGDEREHGVGNPVEVLDSAFLRRIASRVSNSGGWMSVMSPHLKDVRRRSSMVYSDGFWGQSDEMTMATWAVQVVEGVEELFLQVFFRALRNWMSSTSRTSTSAVAALEFLHRLRAHCLDEFDWINVSVET